MEKIMKLPFIQIGDTRRNNYEFTTTLLLSSIRSISKHNHRYHNENDIVTFTKVQFLNGQSYYSPLSIEDFILKIGHPFVRINGNTYAPVKNIITYHPHLPQEAMFLTRQDTWHFNATVPMFINWGKGDMEMRHPDFLDLWEREVTNVPLIKNLKVASGGNV